MRAGFQATAKDVARHARIALPRYLSLEAGEAAPEYGEVLRLAYTLRAKADDLFCGVRVGKGGTA